MSEKIGYLNLQNKATAVSVAPCTDYGGFRLLMNSSYTSIFRICPLTTRLSFSSRSPSTGISGCCLKANPCRFTRSLRMTSVNKARAAITKSVPSRGAAAECTARHEPVGHHPGQTTSCGCCQTPAPWSGSPWCRYQTALRSCPDGDRC